MSRLTVVPPHVPRHKIRHIGSATRSKPSAETTKVVDLHAYAGRNVIRFPRPDGPGSAA